MSAGRPSMPVRPIPLFLGQRRRHRGVGHPFAVAGNRVGRDDPTRPPMHFDRVMTFRCSDSAVSMTWTLGNDGGVIRRQIFEPPAPREDTGAVLSYFFARDARRSSQLRYSQV